MARLTALKAKNAKPGRHGDGDGLYLLVSPAGGRKWVLRVQANGKRRDMGLGSLKDVPLSRARELATEYRRAFREGRDPIKERKDARKIGTMPTFRAMAQQVYDEHAPGWKNPKHRTEWLSSLERYAFARLGDLPVDQIDGPMVRDVLAEIWLTVPETARRVRQRIGTVLDYAHAKGWRASEAPMRAISKGLPKQPKVKEHLASLPWKELPAFIANMETTLNTSETVRLCLEFKILTASRSGEVRGARWCEIDLEKKSWTIPRERMKAGKAHRVPLSGRCLEILERMKELRTSGEPDALIFEGQKTDNPLSDMSLTMPLRRAGLEITAHGFRSSFRDWCSDATNTPRSVAESCLAHTVKDETERAYARTDYFEKRRALMAQWADFCTGGRGKVVKLATAH